MRLIDAEDLVHVLECQCMRTMEQGCHPRYTKGMRYAIELVKRAEAANIEQIPTIDLIEYLNSKGFAVTDRVWLDSKPCCTCEENDGYCVGCTKLEAWKSKNPMLL